MKIQLSVVVSAILLSGCGMEIDTTTPLQEQAYNAQRETAEESGLIALRPYPNADSVCQVLGKNAMTASYYDSNILVVGCPRTATEARAAMRAAGFSTDASTRSWVFYHMGSL